MMVQIIGIRIEQAYVSATEASKSRGLTAHKFPWKFYVKLGNNWNVRILLVTFRVETYRYMPFFIYAPVSHIFSRKNLRKSHVIKNILLIGPFYFHMLLKVCLFSKKLKERQLLRTLLLIFAKIFVKFSESENFCFNHSQMGTCFVQCVWTEMWYRWRK